VKEDVKLGNIIQARVQEREEKIREALKPTHLWIVDNLPMEVSARIFDHLGYELVVERPDVVNVSDDPGSVRILERWYLQRDGEFLTGHKSLYDKRQDYLRRHEEK